MEYNWQDVYFSIRELDSTAAVISYSSWGNTKYFLRTLATIAGDFPVHRIRIGANSPEEAIMAWWEAMLNSPTSYILHRGVAWKWINNSYGSWQELDQNWLTWANTNRGAKIGPIYEMLRESPEATETTFNLVGYFDGPHLERLCQFQSFRKIPKRKKFPKLALALAIAVTLILYYFPTMAELVKMVYGVK